jgi:hypothetical protein
MVPWIGGWEFTITSGVLVTLALAVAVLRPAWIVDYAKVVLGIVGVITLAAGALVVQLQPLGSRIELDPSTEPMIAVGEPLRDPYNQAMLDFGSDDLYVIAMHSDDAFSVESLRAQRRVSEAIRNLRGVSRVESLVDVYSFRYDAEYDTIEIGKLIEEIPTDPEELARLKERVLNDPLYRKNVVSEDGKTAGMNITFLPLTDREFVELDLDGRIGQILDEETTAERTFYVTGRPHVRAIAHHMMVRDLMRLIPLAVVVAAVLLIVLTGSTRGVGVALSNVLIATLWAYASLVLLGTSLNLITLILGPVLIVIGSFFGVHVMERYEVICVTSATARDAALDCLVYTIPPVLMSGAAAIFGFAALLMASVPATIDLGTYASLGVALVTLLTLTYMPAMLAALPLERKAEHPEAAPLYATRTRLALIVGKLLEVINEYVGKVCIRRPWTILGIWAVVTVIFVMAIPYTVVNTDFLLFFKPHSEVRTDFSSVNRLLTGAVPIFITFNSDEEGMFRTPETLRAIEELETRIEELPGVTQVSTMVDLVKVVNRTLKGGGPETERVPDSRGDVAAAVFAVPKNLMRRFSTSNHSDANLVVRTNRLGSFQIRELEDQLSEVFEEDNLPGGLKPQVVSNTILVNRAADQIAGNQGWQVGIAAISIFILVWSVMRSFRLAVLSMLPNFVPVMMFFGMLGFGAAPLSLATGMIGSIALGISIDDTVHFLTGYRHERERGKTPSEAAQACMVEVGRAMVLGAVTLMTGFLVLLISGFTTIQEFGYLSATTFLICMFGDLTMLPALVVASRA